MTTFTYPGVNTIYMRAPNRFRKLLKNPALPPAQRDPFGLDYPLHDPAAPKNLECIALQRQDFGEQYGAPIGFQATWDNDIAIAWEPVRK